MNLVSGALIFPCRARRVGTWRDKCNSDSPRMRPGAVSFRQVRRGGQHFSYSVEWAAASVRSAGGGPLAPNLWELALVLL